MENKWYQKNIKEIYKELNSSMEGLNDKEVENRLIKYGKNIIPRGKRESLLKIFFSEFKDPIIILLLVAVISSFIVGETFDAFAILFIILIDAIIGTYEENKANNTMDNLTKLVPLEVSVLRNNKKIKIKSEDLVLGDIVYLESGDKVSADLRIIECQNLMVDESILTGESIQVEKINDIIKTKDLSLSEQSNMLFSGTTIVKGRATAIVVETSINTQIGKIANSINNSKDEKSPLTIRVEKLSKQISILVLIVAIIISILLITKKVPYNEIFLSVVALSVSAMPEGLSLALTMALTIASSKMAKKNVVVKKLNSVEALGSCTVIATDKTGTLTVNEQTAKKILLPDNTEYNISGTGYELTGKIEGNKDLKFAKEIALYGTINNEAKIDNNKMIGDSIDIAFLVLGHKLEVDTKEIKILQTIAYESENKYSAVFYEKEGKTYCTIKGSIEKVSNFCNKINLLKKFDQEILNKQNDSLAKEGYRVITIATGEIPKKDNYTEKDIKNLTFIGMVGFIDPIRKEVVNAVSECREAGIKVLMITGDHPLTAFSIGKELNIAKEYNFVTTGKETEEYLKKGEREFDEFVKSKRIFSRVTPIQKLEIVNSLKRSGEFVAVTGDGVNDAPALKSANIGIAMGSGTDIAKDVSKMIIIDNNFNSIVNGVKEGRVAYSNIRKIIFFLISCGFSEVIFFTLSILFNMPLPLIAIQLLWLNVVTDGIQDLSLSFEKAEKEIMKDKVRNTSENLLDKNLLEEVLISGLIIGLLVFFVWYYLIKIANIEIELARSYVMALMVFIQNIHVFNCRSEKKSCFSVPLNSNILMLGGIIISVILHIIMMEVPILANILKIKPIPYINLIHLFLLSFTILIIMELYKRVKYTKSN